ncbi:MAG: glycosyltransferase [Candidatus Pacebacteria bacterium]|nr:glycosyltransferase [Candidatus Paceibacterota bacterium]
MKIALVHDYLVQYGGAERVLEAFCEIFPNAPIFTMVYDEKLTNGAFKDRRIHTSFLQKIPFISSHHRAYPLLMPIAIESFDLNDFDVVLSDSNSYAKGVLTGTDTLHITYCHTPMRYAWDDCHRHMREFEYSKFTRKFLPFGISYLRLWDKISADRPDKYIANSKFVSSRIKKYYAKDSTVIYPPVNLDGFHIAEKTENYYLAVGRALPYKRFDIVIKAFNKLKFPLKIIGKGPEMENLKKMAKDNIEFLGYLNDEEASRYYAKCRALIFPSEEDFGITPLEAMASGRPVIAYRGGGALETVVEDVSGVFFDRQTPEAIVKTVENFQSEKFDPRKIRAQAEKFDRNIFKSRIKGLVESEYENFKNNQKSWN